MALRFYGCQVLFAIAINFSALTGNLAQIDLLVLTCPMVYIKYFLLVLGAIKDNNDYCWLFRVQCLMILRQRAVKFILVVA